MYLWDCVSLCVVNEARTPDIKLTVKSKKSGKVSLLPKFSLPTPAVSSVLLKHLCLGVKNAEPGEATSPQQPTRGKDFGLNEKAGSQVQNQCTWSLNPYKDKYKRDLIYLRLSLRATNWCIPCSWWMLSDTSTLFCFKVSITAWCPHSVRSTEVNQTWQHTHENTQIPACRCPQTGQKSVASERNTARCLLVWEWVARPSIKQTAMD